MRLIDAEQYRKEFLDSRDFEPMKILDLQPTVNAVPIPEGATNGDMIMAMFNCTVIGVLKGKVYVEHIYFPFDEDWWNAPYQAKSEDRELGLTDEPNEEDNRESQSETVGSFLAILVARILLAAVLAVIAFIALVILGAIQY